MLKQLLFLLLSLLLLTSCSISQPKSETKFPMQLLIDNQDLPRGWLQTSEYDLSVNSDNREYVVYFGLSQTLGESDLISHDIIITDDLEKTSKLFEKIDKQWFSHGIETGIKVHFEPINPNDSYHLFCEEKNMSVVDCSFLQQHQNIVSLVLAKIDGKNISLIQFETLIKHLDDRLQEYNP